MSRQARVVVEGVPHHITQRGNNRQDTFLLDEDRRIYVETLRAKSKQHGVAILGYCWKPNPVHLVAVRKRSTSLALAIGQTHWRHTTRGVQRITVCHLATFALSRSWSHAADERWRQDRSRKRAQRSPERYDAYGLSVSDLEIVETTHTRPTTIIGSLTPPVLAATIQSHSHEITQIRHASFSTGE